jgi:ankyrin repeat protein
MCKIQLRSILLSVIQVFIVATLKTGMGNTAQAVDYLVTPQSCDKGTPIIENFNSPEEILLDCAHDQGKTPTCGFHATTALLTALYKQSLQAHERKPGQGNLSVFDLISKMGKTLDDSISPFEALWKAKKELNALAENTNGMCISDYNEIKYYRKMNNSECSRNEHAISPQATDLFFNIKFLFLNLPCFTITEKDAKAKNIHELRDPSQSDQKHVVLPKFNIRTWRHFDTPKQFSEIIINHFKKQDPKDPKGPLPLALSICTMQPCDKHKHAVIATGIQEKICADGSTKYGIIFQNSWGGSGNGPFDLDTLASGIKEGNSIIEINPCHDNCLEHIENDTDQHSAALYFYSLAGETNLVKRVVSINNDFYPVIDGTTPLLIAAQNGHKEIVEALLNARAPVDQAGSSGITPLWIAAQNGHKEIVEALLNARAPVDQADSYGITPLWIAAQNGHKEIVKALLKAQAQVDQADSAGITPLLIAAEKGHIEVVEILLGAGANVNQAHHTGTTPLLIAATNGHRKIVEVLLETGANVNQANNIGITPLWIAAKNGHREVVKVLLGAGADVNQAYDIGVTPLLIAATNGHKEIVEALLGALADVNQANDYRVTPLLMAAEKGHREVVKVLLRAGADVNHANNYGVTPLWIAAQNGHREIVEILLEAGADASRASIDGVTPVSIAKQKNHSEVVQLLNAARLKRINH